MRKLMLSVILTGVFGATQAQTSKEFNFNDTLTLQGLNQRMVTSGNHLKRFTFEYYTGMSFAAAGVIITTLPLYTNMNESTSNFSYRFGAAFSAIGILATVLAHDQIRKAGISLRGNGISIDLN